jgi:hypothetical protein
LSELKAVTVISGSFAAGDTKRAATVLNSIDVATVGGGNADITAAVKTLPGAQQIGEQEGLFVRGGTGYETKQFIDGTVVNNPITRAYPTLQHAIVFHLFCSKELCLVPEATRRYMDKHYHQHLFLNQLICRNVLQQVYLYLRSFWEADFKIYQKIRNHHGELTTCL